MKFKDVETSKYLYRAMNAALGGATASHCQIVKELSKHFKTPSKDSELVCEVIELGHDLMVKTLIECKIEYLLCHSNGCLPAGLAAEKGNLEIMKILIDAAWEEYKVTQGTGETFLEYFEKRSDFVNERQPFTSFSIYSWSCRKNYPFFLAIIKGNLPMVQYLVSRSFDVNARNRDTHTPLIVATSSNHIEIVKFLLEMGADIDAKTTYNVTCLNASALQGNKEMFDLLLDSGATVFHPEEDRSDLIAHAIDGRNEEIVKKILDLGVDPDFLKFRRETPLTYAVGHELPIIVKLLLEAGANIRSGDLARACSNGNIQIVELLIEAGATVDIDCVKKAIEKKNSSCLKYIVENSGRAVFTDENRKVLSEMFEKIDDVAMNSYLRSIKFA